MLQYFRNPKVGKVHYEKRCLFQCILLHTLVNELKTVVISVARLNIILPQVNQGFNIN